MVVLAAAAVTVETDAEFRTVEGKEAGEGKVGKEGKEEMEEEEESGERDMY